MTPEAIKTPHELVNRPLKVYLAGPIQAATDGGVAWRREISTFLMGLNMEVLDPTIYEAKELGNPESVKNVISECISNEDWERFDHLVDLLIDRDIKLVHEADFVVALVDTKVQSSGTVSEIWESVQHAKKPVYAVSFSPKKEWSYWLLRTVRRHGKVFHGWKELMTFLEKTYGKPSE